MKNNSLLSISPQSEISSSEWLMLNQFLHEIKQINTACVSVYYPFGKGHEMISLLEETKRNQSIEKIESEMEKKITQIRKKPSSVGNLQKLFVFLDG